MKKVVKKKVVHKKAVAKPVVQPQPTLDQMLDTIDGFLANGDQTDKGPAKQLWDILTALRGPDNMDDLLKTSTTSIIRVKAFPKATSLYNDDDYRDKLLVRRLALNRQGTLKEAMARALHQTRDEVWEPHSRHFGNHAVDAIKALESIGR